MRKLTLGLIIALSISILVIVNCIVKLSAYRGDILKLQDQLNAERLGENTAKKTLSPKDEKIEGYSYKDDNREVMALKDKIDQLTKENEVLKNRLKENVSSTKDNTAIGNPTKTKIQERREELKALTQFLQDLGGISQFVQGYSDDEIIETYIEETSDFLGLSDSQKNKLREIATPIYKDYKEYYKESQSFTKWYTEESQKIAKETGWAGRGISDPNSPQYQEYQRRYSEMMRIYQERSAELQKKSPDITTSRSLNVKKIKQVLSEDNPRQRIFMSQITTWLSYLGSSSSYLSVDGVRGEQ
ncbi:MAG: hypothetical protein A2W23_03415 [Planctomycetes bacterium RBG_16_43_13]|nr:MAG: hypothetical protein A2W23_03415 [Planctomycetes bacterium RBG_16_43_13]